MTELNYDNFLGLLNNRTVFVTSTTTRSLNDVLVPIGTTAKCTYNFGTTCFDLKFSHKVKCTQTAKWYEYTNGVAPDSHGRERLRLSYKNEGRDFI